MTRHRIDAVSLVFGIAFAAVGVRYLGGDLELGRLPRPGWLLPVVVIAAGIGVIAWAVGRSFDPGSVPPEPAEHPTEPVADGPSTERSGDEQLD